MHRADVKNARLVLATSHKKVSNFPKFHLCHGVNIVLQNVAFYVKRFTNFLSCLLVDLTEISLKLSAMNCKWRAAKSSKFDSKVKAQ